MRPTTTSDLFVFSAFTPAYYERAVRLGESLEALGIEHEIRAVPGEGDWYANTKKMPRVIHDFLKERKKPMYWIDADAVVLRMLDPNPRGDLGYVARLGFRFSGVLWLKPTKEVFYTLDEWAFLCEHDAGPIGNMPHFQVALDHFKGQVIELPYEYVYSKGWLDAVDPVVDFGPAGSAHKEDLFELDARDVKELMRVPEPVKEEELPPPPDEDTFVGPMPE